MPPEEQRMSMITNPMCYTFPRIAACDYHRYGAGGVQENVNAICILALNIINDKVILKSCSYGALKSEKLLARHIKKTKS